MANIKHIKELIEEIDLCREELKEEQIYYAYCDTCRLGQIALYEEEMDYNCPHCGGLMIKEKDKLDRTNEVREA